MRYALQIVSKEPEGIKVHANIGKSANLLSDAWNNYRLLISREHEQNRVGKPMYDRGRRSLVIFDKRDQRYISL